MPRLLLIAFGLLLELTATAKADVGWYYGSVVCNGNQALVRFVMAYNEDAPDFSNTPGILGGDLRKLKPVDPSRCRLADGREVVLRELGLADSAALGPCGGDEDQAFSLWIGEQKLYSRERRHNKCNNPFSIASIFYNGAKLFECQLEQAWPTPPLILSCRDDSARLEHPLPETEPGDLKLIRFAPGQEVFCRTLVSPQPASSKPPHYAEEDPIARWPTRVWLHRPTIGASGHEIADQEVVDLDNNDASPELGVSVTPRIGPELGYQMWMLLPEDTAPDAIEVRLSFLDAAFRNADIEALIASWRQAGLRIFAGDQTAYRSADYVALRPFQIDGITYMEATWQIFREDLPVSIVVRPNVSGGLDEMCAWQTILPL